MINKVVLLVLLILCLWPGSMAQAQAQAQEVGSCPGYYLSPQQRMGINVAREAGKEITDYPVTALGAGWYLDYTWHDRPAHPPTSAPPGAMIYMPMVRPQRFVSPRGTETEGEIVAGILAGRLHSALATAIANNPGSTWLLGNEPDNPDQDRQHPDDYAIFYHTAYHLIKALDPTAQIAMAGVTQVTPLRLRYLEAVLAHYQSRFETALPVDVWTIHAYILPEEGEGERASVETWGIGVPPGVEAYAGEALRFTQDQHDDLHLFAAQIIGFRAWLAAHGYRETPLYVTEYGALLSPHHGFDEERLRRFFLGSTAYLQQARDAATGYPPDGHRLVQRWAWFSLNFYAFDPDPANARGLEGLNGNLFDHGSGAITPLGETFAAFGERLHSRTVDLAVQREEHHPRQITVVNRGDAPAAGFRMRLWWGATPLATVPIETVLRPHCGNTATVALQWQGLPTGEQSPLRVELLPALGQVEYARWDN